MRTISAALATVVTGLAALCACTQQTPPAPPAPPKPPFKVVATAKQVMLSITIPTADVVWKVPNETPKDDAAWLVVENNALALAESGNLLMMEGRAVDQGEWMKHASDLVTVSTKAVEAARAKNADQMAQIGDELYTVCESCHMKYMKQEAPPR